MKLKRQPVTLEQNQQVKLTAAAAIPEITDAAGLERAVSQVDYSLTRKNVVDVQRVKPGEFIVSAGKLGRTTMLLGNGIQAWAIDFKVVETKGGPMHTKKDKKDKPDKKVKVRHGHR